FTVIILYKGYLMIEKNISFKDIDAKLTKKWLHICVERFSVKLPYSIINYSIHNYNNIKFELIPNQNINSFNALIDKRKREIKRLEVPKGLSSTIRREEKKLGSYLITFRSFGNKFPNYIAIEGYYLANNYIVFYKTYTKDGYLLENPEVLNDNFEKEYTSIKNIKDNLFCIFDKRKIDRGFCLENKAIIKIKEKQIQNSYVSVHFRNKYFRGYIRVKAGSNVKKDFNFEKLELENELVEISKCIINGHEGVLSKIVNKVYKNNTTFYNAEYLWGYEKANGDIDYPIIIINLKESFKSPYIQQKDKGELDKIFNNILASFHKR
ncbi:hypothetical protein, partial [Malaciobacter mytili]|uniref:hypothetical protein n=2 Tax=Malaciobacter mytili TaxID=603050 RepID=UPI001D18A831